MGIVSHMRILLSFNEVTRRMSARVLEKERDPFKPKYLWIPEEQGSYLRRPILPLDLVWKEEEIDVAPEIQYDLYPFFRREGGGFVYGPRIEEEA